MLSDVETGIRGRISYTIPTDEPSKIEALPTIRSAILHGRRRPLIPLNKSYWRRNVRTARPRITIMLVIDSSRSSHNYLMGLGSVLENLFNHILDSESKVGMVAIQNDIARLLFTPTRNRLRVIGGMKELKCGGYSPLDNALKIARRELVRIQRADPAHKSMLLLVSDCYPEPLPIKTLDPYESKEYKAVRHQAKLLTGARLPVVVVDPTNPHAAIAETLPGRRLARFIAKSTNGSYINIPAEKVSAGGFRGPKFIVEEKLDRESMKIAEGLSGVSDILRKTDR